MTHHHLPTQQAPSICYAAHLQRTRLRYSFFLFVFLFFFTFALTDPIYVILEDHATLTLSRHFPCPFCSSHLVCASPKCTPLLRWLVVSSIVFTHRLSFCFVLLHAYRYSPIVCLGRCWTFVCPQLLR
ncbi:hypothetical protein BDV09DRAFT_94278 [Aspergillus tetrazonus]